MTNEEREDLNTFKHDLVKQARWWQWKAETLEKENEQLKSENTALRNEADENAALSMENKMRADRLETENAALRERLEKAVELPCKIGDKVYMPWVYDEISGIAEITVCSVTVFDGEYIYDTDLESDDIDFKQEYSYGQFRDYDFGTKVFTTREAAVARLAELKGGEE